MTEQSTSDSPYAPGPFGRLAAWVLAHRAVVLGIYAVILVISAVLGLPPDVDANLLSLLPPNEPEVQALKALQAEEGGVNVVTLAFGCEDPVVLSAFADEAADRLGKLDGVEWAMSKVEPSMAQRLGLLQLAPNDVDELTVRVKGALALGPALNPIVTQRLMDLGPIAKRIQSASEARFLEQPEGQARVLLRPSGSAHDRSFSVPFMAKLDATLETLRVEHPEVRVLWVGGAYRHNVEDLKGIQVDMVWTSVASFVLVLGCIIVSFRSLKSTVLVFLPLLVANVVNLGLVWVIMGPLNTYTSFGTAILIGLGIDFAVHLVLRYREEHHTGVGVEAAIITAWDRVGPPCTTAALTSAAGFLALTVAEFQGFAQLGIVLALGLMICLVAMLTLLPLLIVWLDHTPPTPVLPKLAESAAGSSYRLAPAALMIAVVVTTLVGARVIPTMEWEFDFSALRRDGLAYDELTEVERTLAKESYSPIVVSYPDADAMAAGQKRWEKRIAEGDLPHIKGAVSLASVLPPDQGLRLQRLEALQQLLDNPNMRYLPPPLVKMLLPLRGATLSPMQREDLPAAVRDMLGAHSEGRYRVLLMPSGNMWDLREASALGEELKGVSPVGRVAGEYPTLGALYRVTLRDIPRVGLLALTLVGLLTLIDLRKVHWAVGAMLTLLAGMSWAAALVHLAGVKLSILNVVGVPILLGIGIDVIIHLLHRLSEEGPGGVRRALRTTGLAVGISTMTTVMSFLSLTLAGNRGVRSLGMLVVLGLIAVAMVGATMLPLAWAAGWRVTGRAPGDESEP